MLQFQGGSSRLKSLSIAVILSVVFSQASVLVFLCTVPLYALYYSRGVKDLMIGSGSVMFIILVLSLWKIRSVNEADLKGVLVVIEMLIPILLVLGMFFIINIVPVFSGLRRLYRLFLATVICVLVFIPIFVILQQNNELTEAVSSQMNALAGVILGEGSGSYEGEVVKTYLGEEGFMGYMKNFYLRSFAAIFFLVLLVNARAAELIMHRLQRRKALLLTEFKVPDVMLWPSLLVSVGMLVEIFELVDLGYASSFIWNAGLVMLFLYGMQGVGIIRSLFIRFNLPTGLRLMIEALLILMLLIPGINYVVIIGLPVLGISETWINLRKPIRST